MISEDTAIRIFDRVTEELTQAVNGQARVRRNPSAEAPWVEAEPLDKFRAAIFVSFNPANDYFFFRFGKCATGAEWVESVEELESAVENVLMLSRAVIDGRFTERVSECGGCGSWSVATIDLNGRRRTIFDGSLRAVICSLWKRCRRVEYRYQPYDHKQRASVAEESDSSPGVS